MTVQMSELAIQKVEHYLFRLGVAMGDLPASERDESLREIRGHILDTVAGTQGPLDAAVDAVLARLGTPEQLASAFERDSSLDRASRSSSPLVWVATTARLALSGITGFVSFLIAIFGYSVGGVLVLAGFLKPLFPKYFGLFVSPESITLNRQGLAGEHKILGAYFLPIVLILGGLMVVGTTLLLKWIWGRSRKAKSLLRLEESMRKLG
jgi:hypothetical protein